eukprot:jgi/Chlat1/2324/Chrsp17S02801
MASANNGVSVDSDLFASRLKRLYATWKADVENGWSGASALAIATPPTSEDLRYLKSESLHMWLFGYQLPETILVFMRSSLHAVTSQKKANILESLKGACKQAANLELKLHVKGKNDDGSTQIKEVLDAISKEGKPTVGILQKETPEGALLTRWSKSLEGTGLRVVDIAAGLADVFATKDAVEVTNIKKAAFMSAGVMKNFVEPKVVGIIEEEQKITHAKLSDMTEQIISTPTKIDIKLKAENLDVCYPPVFQSGGNYDLKPSAGSDDKTLHYGVIVCSLGARYSSYCANIARTYLVDPTDQQQEVYKVLLAAQEAAVDALRPGAKLSASYEAAVAVIKRQNEELLPAFTKNVGCGIGLEFRENTYVLNAKNQLVARPGMAFNITVGFHNLTNPKASDSRAKTYSLLLADTIIIREGEKPEVATAMAPKGITDVAYSFQDGGDDGSKESNDEGAEEDQEIVAQAKTRGQQNGESVVLNTSLRSENQQKSAEALRRERQAELARQKNEESMRRFAAGEVGADQPGGSNKKDSADVVAYRHVDEIPTVGRELTIQVDQRHEAVLLPIYGVLLPFHVSTIKSVTSQQDGGHSFLRINFNIPGTGFAAGYPPAIKYPNSIFLKELSYRSSDVRHVNQIVSVLKTLQRQVRQRDTEQAERATLVTQQRLITSKGRVYRLEDLWIRPAFGGRGRKLPGVLECHTNGFRYSTRKDEEQVDIMFENIKHAFFQPAENEMITLLHFHLKHPIMVGKKKTKDVQFYAEVMDVVQNVDGMRRSAYDPDEIEEEQKERERRNRVNMQFQKFVKLVNEVWEREYKQLDLEFDVPFRDLGFNGVPYKSSAFCIPTVNCLVELIEQPFLVITLNEIEVVNLERVGFGLKNFDMAIVFKDWAKEPHRIDAIESKSLDTIKEWLTSMNIKYYEGRINLNWKLIMKTILDDPQKFFADGGWEFLNNEASDDEEAHSTEESDGYAPSGSEVESDDASSSDSESLVESDDDEYEGSEEEESEEEDQGKSWDELEAEARRADKEKGSDIDSEEERRAKRKPKATDRRPPPPTKKMRR